MSKEKEPFERLMLKQMKPKNYIKKLESIVIEEGKRILNSLRINYMIVDNKQIERYQDKHPEFVKLCWKQLGLNQLYRNNKVTSHQYDLLIRMKQALNKNSRYLLRGDQFKLRNKVLGCKVYKEVKELCYSKDCPCFIVCPKHYKNDNKYWNKELSKGPATKNETSHLLHCKSKHHWIKVFPDCKEMLLCRKTRRIVDLTTLHEEIFKRNKEN